MYFEKVCRICVYFSYPLVILPWDTATSFGMFHGMQMKHFCVRLNVA